MRLYLDQTVLMWMRRDFKRDPVWKKIEPLISREGALISFDLRHGDKAALNRFAVALIMRKGGQTYSRAYGRIAREVAAFLGQSVVDQLAALVNPPEPKVVKMGKTPRERALEKRMNRHG
ncbi:MAG TPA: hypothetical protein VFH61_12220 [Thermoleophilia bacterium]|nr:hypothetical protein [Thermoleophilia bacterium]